MENAGQEDTLKDHIVAAELASSRPDTQGFTYGEGRMFREYIIVKSGNEQKSHPAYFGDGASHAHAAGLVWNPVDAKNLIDAINSADQRDFGAVA